MNDSFNKCVQTFNKLDTIYGNSETTTTTTTKLADSPKN